MIGSMLRNALRAIRKGGLFSFINIGGLAISLSVCLLVVLYVVDECSYDRYNENADHIFRIVYDTRLNGNSFVGNFAPFPMGPALVRDYPDIEKAVRIQYQGDIVVRNGKEKEIETRAVFADPSLFEIFTLPMIEGDPGTALLEPHTIVITRQIARKYFSHASALGKTLVIENNGDTITYKVTGVIKDIPAASHFHFEFFRSMTEKKPGLDQQWVNPYCATYLLAKPGVTAEKVNRMLASSVNRYVLPQLRQATHASPEEMARKGDYFREYCIPLTHIHLYSHVSREFEPNGSIQTIYIFLTVSLFIVLLACTNFMNLYTARNADRAREVGIRKILGASGRELIAGFLVESVLASLMAFLLAVLITMLLLPFFNRLAGTAYPIGVLSGKWLLAGCIPVTLSIAVLAGGYPAVYLSAFKPLQVLRGRLATGFKRGWFSSGLIVFQFTVAICLVIGTLVIYSQLRYMRNRDLGFDREQILTVSNTDRLGSQAAIFRDEAGRLPGVTGSTMTGDLPGRVRSALIAYFKTPSARGNEAYLLQRWYIDTRFVPLLNMRFASGRNFSPEISADSSGILINETAARLLGYTDAVGKPLFRGAAPEDAFHILGVVKDFNGGSLHDPIEPIVFQLAEDRHAVSFRIQSANIPEVVAAIKDRYRSLPRSAGLPFAYSFMDENFDKLYESDRRTYGIFISFACFAIMIACLGLFGLAAYGARRRAREIGIRKVLGATAGRIVGSMSYDFMKLVLLATVISCPVAGWAMHRWLEDFAFRTTLVWWVFLLPIVLAGLVTLLTVCTGAISVAMRNPVQTLRESN